MLPCISSADTMTFVSRTIRTTAGLSAQQPDHG
jgi:hypothetical protein